DTGRPEGYSSGVSWSARLRAYASPAGDPGWDRPPVRVLLRPDQTMLQLAEGGPPKSPAVTPATRPMIPWPMPLFSEQSMELTWAWTWLSGWCAPFPAWPSTVRAFPRSLLMLLTTGVAAAACRLMRSTPPVTLLSLPSPWIVCTTGSSDAAVLLMLCTVALISLALALMADTVLSMLWTIVRICPAWPDSGLAAARMSSAVLPMTLSL